MPSVLPDLLTHNVETDRLLGLCRTLSVVAPAHRKLVAEIVLLRLFSLFENVISSVCLKLVCGARYADGTLPNLLFRARSVPNARVLLQTHGRPKERQLKWSKASEIKDNIQYLIAGNDNLVVVVDRNGVLIDEVRRVRNRIAHNNAQSRKQYREIVRRHYGAFQNQVTPGMLLLTTRISPSLLEQFIRKQRILIKDALKA